MNRIWDRTAEVGFALLSRLHGGADPRGGNWLHLWRRVSSENEYKQLWAANLQDYLQRLEDPQFDPNFEVHFVPQIEWFSENGAPHYQLVTSWMIWWTVTVGRCRQGPPA